MGKEKNISLRCSISSLLRHLVAMMLLKWVATCNENIRIDVNRCCSDVKQVLTLCEWIHKFHSTGFVCNAWKSRYQKHLQQNVGQMRRRWHNNNMTPRGISLCIVMPLSLIRRFRHGQHDTGLLQTGAVHREQCHGTPLSRPFLYRCHSTAYDIYHRSDLLHLQESQGTAVCIVELLQHRRGASWRWNY